MCWWLLLGVDMTSCSSSTLLSDKDSTSPAPGQHHLTGKINKKISTFQDEEDTISTFFEDCSQSDNRKKAQYVTCCCNHSTQLCWFSSLSENCFIMRALQSQEPTLESLTPGETRLNWIKLFQIISEEFSRENNETKQIQPCSTSLYDFSTHKNQL